MTHANRRPMVLGLTGPGGVGKSTVARALLKTSVGCQMPSEFVIAAASLPPLILHIGGPIKAMLAAFYADAGVSAALIQSKLDGDLKRTPCHYLGGKTPTHAMQTLGTEWGRQAITPTLWLDQWSSKATAAFAEGRMVINDSVRFENEAAAIRNLGGVVVKLTGRRGDLEATHASEAGVQADLEVSNSGTSEETAAAVLFAVRKFLLYK